MKILIVIHHHEHYWFNDDASENITNQETWLFNTDDDLNLNWYKYKTENPMAKLYEYLEYMGGTLLNFEELII